MFLLFAFYFMNLIYVNSINIERDYWKRNLKNKLLKENKEKIKAQTFWNKNYIQGLKNLKNSIGRNIK